MITSIYKNLDNNLLKKIKNEFIKFLDLEKSNNCCDTRNIKKNIGRPRKISLLNVVLFTFKTICGSKLEDLVNDPKEISSYQKYIRKLKMSKILDKLYEQKIIQLYNDKKLDISCIHVDSTDILNLYGNEDVGYGYKFKNKKSTRIHLAISNNEIPLSVHITGANKNDSTQLKVNLANIPFKVKTSNKKSTYVVIDKGYASKNNFNIIEKEYKYKMLCPPKSNSNMNKYHNITLFNRLKRKYNQEKYINRLKIERFFSLTKKFPKIIQRYDRKSICFMGSIKMILLNIAYIRS